MNQSASTFAGAVSFTPFSRGNFNAGLTCYTHYIGRNGLSKIYVPSTKSATLYRSRRLKNYNSGAQKSCSLKCYKLVEEGLLGVKLCAHEPRHYLNQQFHNQQNYQVWKPVAIWVTLLLVYNRGFGSTDPQRVFRDGIVCFT